VELLDGKKEIMFNLRHDGMWFVNPYWVKLALVVLVPSVPVKDRSL
jgi:hypothetical protein